jgi:hypothetical protein
LDAQKSMKAVQISAWVALAMSDDVRSNLGILVVADDVSVEIGEVCHTFLWIACASDAVVRIERDVSRWSVKLERHLRKIRRSGEVQCLERRSTFCSDEWT